MKAEDYLMCAISGKCNKPYLGWDDNLSMRDRYRTEALKAGYEDDVEAAAEARIKIYKALNESRLQIIGINESGHDAHFHDSQVDSFAKALNIPSQSDVSDDLPDDELLPCPVCGFKLTWSTLNLRHVGDEPAPQCICCGCGGQSHFVVLIPDKHVGTQQAINAANAAIRELGR